VRRVLPWILLPLAWLGCERPAASPRAPLQPPTTEQSASVEPKSAVRIVILGDSLTAGLGLPEDQAYPRLIEVELRLHGWSVEVVNAGVSGDTTAGGRSRLGWLLEQRPQILVVGLGANDGLRGLPVAAMEANLRAIVLASRDAGAKVLLAGMQVPPNYGAEYAAQFGAVFPDLASELAVPLVPFLLEDVGGRPELNQADGIHPNAAGHRIIASHLVPPLEELLRQVTLEGAA
jgi:acyl-CoA thioesterase-1